MTEEEKKKRLRYLQLKAKAVMSGPTGSTGSITGGPDKPGSLAAKGAVTAVQEEPVGAVAGLVKGFGSPYGKDPDAKRQPLPLSSPTGSMGQTSTEGRKPLFDLGTSLTPEQREVSEMTRPIGEFAGKAIPGAIASTAVPGAGFLPTLAKGAVANMPFTAERVAEGDLKGAGVDVALNTALDALMFGTGKLVSSGLKKLGKNTLLSQLGMKEPLQKQISSSFDMAQEKIVDIIDKNKLNKVLGNFSKMSKSADDMATTKWKAADAEVNNFVKANPNINKFADINKMYADLKTYLQSPDSPLASDELEGAVKLVDKIISGQKTKGLIPESGLVDLNGLVKIKRDLKKGKNLFRLGTGQATGDPMKVDVYKAAFINVIDKISNEVPKAKELNTAAKELMWVSEAADHASSRARKRNQVFDATTLIAGTGGGAAAVTNPDKAILAIALAALVIGSKKAGGQGRGPALAKLTGKAIEKFPKQPGFATTSAISEAFSKTKEDEKENQPYRLPGFRY